MFEEWSIQETAKRLSGDVTAGLSDTEALKRLREDGPNELPTQKKRGLAARFFVQLNDPLIYVLVAAAGISVALGEVNDAVIIISVIVLNALVGLVQEGRAQRALDSLKKLTSPVATVVRAGQRMVIPASEIVCGDLVWIEAGCLVPADLRLVQTHGLTVEESALTGESLPVEKDAAFLVTSGQKTPLGDHRNMAYMSTMVTAGQGYGLAVATGAHTQIGEIAHMIGNTGEEMTPLQKRLAELGTFLSILSLILCAALFGLAIHQKRNVFEMLLSAISLAVAAVPEGLPAVVTICLALSVTRMVKAGCVIRRLPSVETLGAVSVVCSDKTGTLTQNCMTVEKCWVDGKITLRDLPRDFLQASVLCNDASILHQKRIGDPTELALLDLGEHFGFHKEKLEESFERLDVLAFDSERKKMTTFHSHPSGLSVSYTKGAPEEVLKCCTCIAMDGRIFPLTDPMRQKVQKAAATMAREALRSLALAMKPDAKGPDEEGLTFLGLLGMRDPARPEAAESVAVFRKAGVDTVMITGDHVQTALAIAGQLGIASRESQCMTGAELAELTREELLERLRTVRVFARVSPAQKVRIVEGFQALGKIVAMTGDGVNDAPSLKRADIGIAMGKGGTDVARQASDMVLTDDNFATIRKAIEEGRGVYENIRKSVIFLLSSNLGELLTMFCAVLFGLAAPLRSAHILWINLITDSLPALALGVDKNDAESLMRAAPREPRESLFARGGLALTCFYGVLIALISLTAFLLLPIGILREGGQSVSVEGLCAVFRAQSSGALLSRCQTYAFTVLGMSQLFHAVGMRDVCRPVFGRGLLENKLMLFAVVCGLCLQLAVTEIPVLVDAFGTVRLSLREWGMLSLLAAFPLLAHEGIALGHGSADA